MNYEAAEAKLPNMIPIEMRDYGKRARFRAENSLKEPLYLLTGDSLHELSRLAIDGMSSQSPIATPRGSNRLHRGVPRRDAYIIRNLLSGATELFDNDDEKLVYQDSNIVPNGFAVGFSGLRGDLIVTDESALGITIYIEPVDVGAISVSRGA